MGAGAGSIANSKVLENDAPTSNSSSSKPSVPSGKTVTTAATEGDLSNRVEFLEKLIQQQALQLQQMAKALEGVQKDVRRTVSVMQYNILASYLGKNTQPWFLYGAEIEPEAREKIFKLFNQRGPDGTPKHKWPEYVEGILSPEQIQEVETQDAFFRWESRREKLVNQIVDLDPDVVSLVELDDHAFFGQSLEGEWDSVFRKRPRANSADGCGIFWRRSKFELVASEGFDMIDGNDDKGREKRDRSCLMVLLKWKTAGNNVAPLVVVSTHLAKDPYNKAQTAIRVRQVTQIMATLTSFTGQYQARDSPVILLGDLNARHFGEIRGIARTVWQIKGDPIHKFLWHATDVNTGATSVTKARHCRIDVVQYLSSHMEVVDVNPMPKLKDGEEEDSKSAKKKYRITQMYSATMPPAIERMARSFLRCPAIINVGDPGQAKKDIEQNLEFIGEAKKKKRLEEMLVGAEPPIIVFVNQKKAVDVLSKSLDNNGYRVCSIHGGKSQEQREWAMNSFKEGRYDILVATDVAGRGLDIEGVQRVINFDMPKTIEDYTHRIGRTGRAGLKGLAISFVTPEDSEIFYDLTNFLKSSNQVIPPELASHPASKFKPGTVNEHGQVMGRKLVDQVVFAKK